ncbi:AraC-like DNA-binding protein [Fontibacillus solani]|uniref:AraC-like DNA-binding protein n=1 Tax=Fontibacillus solani TaxID=1572857 RepID=A0A7W3XRJ7_9BACL|nr:AraC family transcriptional regulator [Fontibacillus solani]MBA9085551.1 AraC-like DNA-binding protein [Fontibacillus solani]
MSTSQHNLLNEQHSPYHCQLLYAGKLNANPDWKLPLHKHEDLHEIIFIVKGVGTYIIDDKVYTAKKGDLLIYNRGILHEERSHPEDPLFTYYCGFRFLPLIAETRDWVIHPDREPVIRSNHYSNELLLLMKTLFEEFSIRNEGYEQISQHLFEAVFLLIERMIHAQNHTAKESKAPLANRIKEFLDTNYTHQLNLKDIAMMFHIDSYYLIHIFTNNFGISPINYLIQRRMGEATYLLTTTNKKIWEVAKMVGYENPNYFSIMFTKIVGESPREFRKNNQKNHYNKKN